jgi:hypothetical protein
MAEIGLQQGKGSGEVEVSMESGGPGGEPWQIGPLTIIPKAKQASRQEPQIGIGE